ncbi:hypothetical protein B566_EDAN018047 [Ephemera danica]|nr:hypothetical protein B566_EDAN018047 [Ephemera danica]
MPTPCSFFLICEYCVIAWQKSLAWSNVMANIGAVGWESEALVFLNHVLDVAEAVEKLDSGGPAPLVDGTDLASTDFPLDAPLPSVLTVPQDALEEAREWLLAVSMDQRLDQRGVYAASLRTDAACAAVPACVLSSWPVLGDLVRLGSRCAIKEEWNRVLLASRAHRDSKLEDVLRFLTSWCGSLPEGFAFGM